MKGYIIGKTRRLALGLSQKELSEMACVSASTICKYESGEEISKPYEQQIRRAIDDQFNGLTTEEWSYVNLKAQVLQLNEETSSADKLLTIAYMEKTLSNMQINLLKQVMRETNR